VTGNKPQATCRNKLAWPADNEEHMRWVYEHAAARAKEFGIQVGQCLLYLGSESHDDGTGAK